MSNEGCAAQSAADPLVELREGVADLRTQLLNHRVYSVLRSPTHVLRFMELHCFAVVDFMCLLKSLQQRLTCTSVPWFPPASIATARFINEIVVAEESDEARNGGYISHYEMYLQAMVQAGADTAPVKSFVELVRNQQHYRRALRHANVPKAAAAFVTTTMSACLTGKNHEVAALFVIGREQLIPNMFVKLVRGLHDADRTDMTGLLYYLQRHIEIDGEQHGPLAEQMLRYLCGDVPRRWKQARKAAETALRARIMLWDAVVEAVENPP